MSSQAIKMLSGMDKNQARDGMESFGGFPGDITGQGLVRAGGGLSGRFTENVSGENKAGGSADPGKPRIITGGAKNLIRAVQRRQQVLNYDLKRSMRVDRLKARKILSEMVRVSLAAPQTRVLIRKVKTIARIVDEFLEDPCVVTYLARIAVHDHTTQMHLVNVMLYCMGYACQNGGDRETVKMYGLAGLLHDVGKIFIPDYLLNAPRDLTLKEKKKIRKHSETGFRLLKPRDLDDEILTAVRDHHERLDGSGYPQGKAGDSLGEMARVLAVVDVFDALTTSRTYRQAMTPLAALREIREDVRANRLDKAVFSSFARSVVGMTSRDFRMT
ncbi:MAG: HD domain-containing protein [Desulfobacterales bacterium]|nr:HD domain-containing protein [Desulfobacterales bacterium]